MAGMSITVRSRARIGPIKERHETIDPDNNTFITKIKNLWLVDPTAFAGKNSSSLHKM